MSPDIMLSNILLNMALIETLHVIYMGYTLCTNHMNYNQQWNDTSCSFQEVKFLNDVTIVEIVIRHHDKQIIKR